MARFAAVPFGLPGLAGERRPLLWWPHLAVLAAGVFLVPFSLVVLLHPQIDHAFAKWEIPAYQHAFGFHVGQVPNDLGGTYWGFTRVAPGGAADRAGVRADDVIFTFHGTPAFTLRWAIESALAGQEACFRVINMRDARAGVRAERTVCLSRPQPVATEQPMSPRGGPTTGTGRADAAALLDAERRQAAFCRLLDARRYHAPPPYTEEPCEPVDDVVVAPQPDGSRLYLVFHNAPVPEGGISRNDARGAFTMIDGDGFIIPVPDGANYLGEHDRLLAPAGNGPLVMVQVYGHAGGDAFGADGWSVQVLHATAVMPGARTLAVAMGPATFGFEDGCRGNSWWWRSRDIDGDGITEIEIGPRLDADDNITPRAVYRWSKRARRYSGPGGSVTAGFQRLPDRGPDCAIGKAAEAFAREHLRRGLTHDPAAVRRPDCVHGTIPAGEPIP